ncbi:hypothetical protein FS749_011291 [Ceratobasidium sp. UAMH 11750]|nr:hypothetical protein FS749_011291 [Ceratobasidium sp. UAMH 11750]
MSAHSEAPTLRDDPDQRLADFDLTLIDLRNLGHRVILNEPLDVERSLKRIPFIMQNLVNVLGLNGKTAVLMHMMSLTSSGAALDSLVASQSMEAYLHSEECAKAQLVAQSWYTLANARGLTSKYNGLPIYNHEDPYIPFSPQFMANLDHAESKLPGIKNAAKLLMNYELCGPPNGVLGYWDHPASPHRLTFLPTDPPSEEDTLNLLYQAIDDSFYSMEHPLHSTHGPANFRDELSKQPFLDPKTGVLYGGPHGARHGLFLIYRARTQSYQSPG